MLISQKPKKYLTLSGMYTEFTETITNQKNGEDFAVHAHTLLPVLFKTNSSIAKTPSQLQLQKTCDLFCSQEPATHVTSIHLFKAYLRRPKKSQILHYIVWRRS